ncbi:MAG TPA: UDP-N-acetylmuramate dehydrogenase [Thermodesulfobacteriota bacterium]|jgi:UDP-N-acetylmuramate dehydrogenase
MTNNTLERGIKKKGFQGKIRRGVLMSEITSFRIGGPADLCLFPQDRQDLQIVMALFRDRGMPVLLLGNGTNLLVADQGIREPLINLSHGCQEISKQGARVIAGAGCGLPQLLNFCAAHALTGLEALAGIPGTVGGGIRMNAGSWGMEIGDHISSLLVMDHAGETRQVTREQVAFGYRGIRLPFDGIILQGEFSLRKGKKDEIANRIAEFLRKKRETQPLAQPSAGSIFKNPPDMPAGRLIEEVGLKGTRRGDAMISPLHANFIVNMGAAQARDVLALIELIRKRVYQEKRIGLELEVLIIGEQAMA